MQKTTTAPVYIQATGNKQPLTLWELNTLDKSSFQWMLRGTWLFRGKAEAERIKTGLAELLGYYPHLSGRMVNRGTAVQLNNLGVPFTCTSAPQLSLQEVSSRPDQAGLYSNAPDIALVKAGREAPLSIKLTQLADGYVLGVSCSHACLDGMGFYTLVHNWGRLCRGGSIEPPVLDQTLLTARSSRSREEVLADAVRLGWKKFSHFKMIKLLPLLLPGRLLERTSAFYFSAGALGNLKKTMSEAAGCRLSTNEVLCAYLTRMFIQLFGHQGTDCCTQVTVADLRNRLPYIPAAFAGNAAFTIVSARVEAAAAGEIACAIHKGLAPYVEKPSPALQQLISLSLEAMYHRIPFFPYDFTTAHMQKPTTVYINNFSRLPIYTVDFGNGAPVKAFPHNLGDPVLIWPAPPAEGGVEVYFSGVAAHAVHKLAADDTWLNEMRSFSKDT